MNKKNLIENLKDIKSNIQKQLDGKASVDHTHDDLSGVVPAEHQHTVEDITDLQEKLDEKADKTHSHSKEEIPDFPESLPANGGNADTVDGKHATDFLTKSGAQIIDLSEDMKLRLISSGGIGYVQVGNEEKTNGKMVMSGYNADPLEGFSIKCSGTVTVNDSKIYHEGFTPRAHDIGAMSLHGSSTWDAVDLNDYTTPGSYYISNSALKNAPPGLSYVCLRVESYGSGGESYLLQTAGDILSYETFHRAWRGTSNGWSEWRSGNASLKGEVDSLKSSVSSGKNAIASAITAKGISASGSEDFASLANKISQLQVILGNCIASNTGREVLLSGRNEFSFRDSYKTSLAVKFTPMYSGTMKLYYELNNEEDPDGYLQIWLTLMNASEVADAPGPDQIGKTITDQMNDGDRSGRSKKFEVEAGKLYGIGVYGYANGDWSLTCTVKKLQLCYDPA